ncbi:alpha/beta-hydrolase [Macroventuria anomochaeta]|uniref:Alpha/beta-hydrolase n=1 Tax=Macroventuria anomochaeta TaxID=301207 RepID=A0ACB6RKR2_9PLEO|nr:alpha/beta-hydrolase [Macroventuria anomochaeta]KAF2622318.1 alpha/beta-hydrolase [Macroventuria anomochaeta]
MILDKSAARTFTFHHAELGSLTGLVTPDNVVQFRAVPYATIPARFKRSILLGSLPESDGAYTEHGYACPQTFPLREADGGPFPGDPVEPASDEFECLLLQLNIPLAILHTPSTAKLPVLVYIHGGGFVLGKIDEQHSTALMVEQSILDTQPIISASIQYRVGALGYLQTPEPGNANLALNDQRNALRWIQKFIGGFGGDKQRVTVFGESAGSMSICAHMLSPPPTEGPLFQRAVLMSGIIGPATVPVPIEVAEQRYEAFLAKLGIEERGDAGLQKLREVDIDTLVAASTALGDEGGLWLPVQDREWFGEDAASVTWDRIPELIGKCEWVKDIVLGCTSFEGTTMMSRYAGITPSAFLSSIKTQLGAHSAEIISRAYAITPTMDQNLFFTPLLRWVGDAIFDAPTHMLAQYLSTKTTKNVYRYIFDVRNPFPNHALYQQPHHWVDIYFVFKAHQFRFPSQRLKDISTRHAQLWINFTHGKTPWGEYKYTGKGDEVLMVVDEREGWVERSAERVERDLEWGWGRCEELVSAWQEGGMKGEWWSCLELECLSGVKKT